MDALSFAMGERSSTLRVKQLRDLIHGAHIGQPVSDSASVALRYCDDQDQESVFCRRIVGSFLVQLFTLKIDFGLLHRSDKINYPVITVFPACSALIFMVKTIVFILLFMVGYVIYCVSFTVATNYCVLGNFSEYYINDVQFSLTKYLEELETIGIVPKAQNCLVFQVNIIIN